MLNRRDFLQVAAATATLLGTGPGGLARAATAGAITQDRLLQFPAMGNVTLLHVTDIHAQLVPVWFREPAINLGMGEVAGLPPHITGRDFLTKFEIKAGSPEAYALTSEDFVQLARQYGKVGGLDRLATLVKAIRAERGADRVLLLDGGDSLQGSWGALQTRGGDMARALRALGVEGSTGHWEFTYGADRVPDLAAELDCPFLAGNVRDTEWQEDVFDATMVVEKGGVRIAVIGQAFPYTPVANPRWMMPDWSFGIREELVRERVEAARADGADLVVLLSHNGFDVDRKLAGRVPGIDVILTGHTHDALPVAVREGATLLIASGSHGKFLSRLDLDVRDGAVKGFEYRIIPVFADAITPDPEMAALVEELRQPFADQYARVLGTADGALYRRGNFNGTWDDLICDALLAGRDAEIALSPGFRWGASLLPEAPITMEDVWNQTAITYPNAYRMEMTGAQLKDILEDVADNLFNPDPYYQQGGDMVRVGGMGYAIDVGKPMGSRISAMTHLKTGQPIDPSRRYVVAGWASVNEGTEGPPVWDLVAGHITAQKTITVRENQSVRIQGV